MISVRRHLRVASVGLSLMVIGAIAAPAASAAPDIEFFKTSASTSVAGAHPDLSADIQTNEDAAGIVPQTIRVSLPPGVFGNPNAVPQCSQAAIGNAVGAEVAGVGSSILAACPATTQIGEAQLTTTFGGSIAGGVVYDAAVINAEPVGDDAGRIILANPALPAIYASIKARTDGDYGLDNEDLEIDSIQILRRVKITVWGVPGAHSRGGIFRINGEGNFNSNTPIPPDAPALRRPFLSNPTVCDEPKVTKLAFLFYGDPIFHTAKTTEPTPTHCENVPFSPSLTMEPTSHKVGDATGLDVDLKVPQNEDPEGIATSHMRNVEVKLPEGLTLNPSAADGLQACSADQIGYLGSNFPYPNPVHFDLNKQECPDGSKVGTVEVDLPALPGPLHGSVYLAEQYKNPFGTLTAIYLSMEGFGVHVKIAGNVKADPITGRLTTTFTENPQVPFEDFKLHFKGGDRGVLAVPDTCGNHVINSTFTPWSGNPPVSPSNTMAVTESPDGGPCATTRATRPFKPVLDAGSVNATAGAFSNFTVKVTKSLGQQELKRLDFTLPKGLLGKLAGVPYCSELDIYKAEQRTSGVAEQASPTCPASTQIGIVRTTAGAGATPLHVEGKAYLAGPYKGAPVSIVVVNPAVAGPFDLGNVLVRTPLNIDPVTTQLHAVSDPIPDILGGIPLLIRSVEVDINRPNFTLNPTSCDPMSITGHMAAAGSDLVSTADDVFADVSNPFQVSGCSSLGFAPKLYTHLIGGTKRGDHPSLKAVLIAREGDANIRSIAVTLPHSEFLDQAHIRTVCTRVQFAAKACPPGAIYGYAEATSPLVDGTLTGPVYLRSSDNPLPDLVVALKGTEKLPIEINLAGRIDSVNGGIRNTFELVPDAAVSKFVLKMQGGSKGLLVNSRNICNKPVYSSVRVIGQNNKRADQSPKLTNTCHRVKKHKKGA